jgi:hypothetical protein
MNDHSLRTHMWFCILYEYFWRLVMYLCYLSMPVWCFVHLICHLPMPEWHLLRRKCHLVYMIWSKPMVSMAFLSWQTTKVKYEMTKVNVPNTGSGGYQQPVADVYIL